MTNFSSGSKSSAASSELSEVVVDGAGRIVTPSNVKFRPSTKVAPAPTAIKSVTGEKLGLSLDADWTGVSRDYEEWSSDSDIPNTDDEFEDEPVRKVQELHDVCYQHNCVCFA